MKKFEVLNTLTMAQCVEQLFEIQLAKFPKLKEKTFSFIRNELIESNFKENEAIKEARSIGTHGEIKIPSHQLNKMFNVIILAAFFDNVKLVKELFENNKKRNEMSVWLNELLLNRQSVVGVSLLQAEVLEFLQAFSNLDFDLAKQRLPNPFEILPQIALGDKASIMQSLLAQSALLSQGDNMMFAYLNDDFQKAWGYAQSLQTNQPVLLQYKALVEKKYHEAVEFEKTLKDLDF